MSQPEEPPLRDQIAAASEGIRRLRAMQQQFVHIAQEIQSVIAFSEHPDLTELDDELDIMYRGQL